MYLFPSSYSSIITIFFRILKLFFQIGFLIVIVFCMFFSFHLLFMYFIICKVTLSVLKGAHI